MLSDETSNGDPDWQGTVLSDVVGERVRKVREARQLRRVDLAEKCAELGWPALTHGALGHLETGRRDADGVRRREITVDEIMVLAAALGLSPLALVIPVGAAETVELLPNRPMPIDQARRWFDGTSPIEGTLQAELDRMARARSHDRAVEVLLSVAGTYPPERLLVMASRDSTAEAKEALDVALAAYEEDTEDDDALAAFTAAKELLGASTLVRREAGRLRALRRAMARDAEVLPPLRGPLTWIDAMEVADDAPVVE